MGDRPLVGRRAELRAIEDAIDGMEGGAAHVVALVGEPGIGKTRMLAELYRRAEARGHRVLAGGATDLERDLAFGPFVVAVDDHVATVGDELLDQLGAARLAELAFVLPGLAPIFPPRPSVAIERYRGYRAVRSLFEALADPAPLVIGLDDLHWSDPASVELLGHLLRYPPQARVLLALGFRGSQADPGLTSAVEQATRHGSARVLELAPLSRDEAAELVGRQTSSHLLRQLYADSGGIPFYLEELARRPAVGGPNAEEPPGHPRSAVPAAVAAALSAEIRSLSRPARALLEGAAVTGDPHELGLAAQVAELPEADVLEALDELVRVELLHPTDVPRRFRFRHPIVRRAVYEGSGPGWRIGAHRRAAAALVARGAAPAARAPHVEHFALVGDEEAVAVLAETGRAARDPATAVRWFDAALRLLPDHDDAKQRRLELMTARTTALGSAGRFIDCHDALLETLAILPPNQSGTRARLLTFCACIENVLGQSDQARRRLLEALDSLPQRGCVEAVEVQIELCATCLARHDVAEATQWAAQVGTGAERTGDPALLACAAATRALVEIFVSDTPVPTSHADRAAVLFDELPQTEWARYLGGALNLGVVELFIERFSDAVRHLGRGIEVSLATSQGHLLPMMRALCGTGLAALGRLGEAVEEVDAAVEGLRLSAPAPPMALALTAQCHVALATGDTARAAHVAGDALSLPDAFTPGGLSTHLGPAIPAAILKSGDPDQARTLVLKLGGGDSLALIWPARRAAWCEVLTRAALAEGDLEAAEGWAQQAQATSDRLSLALPRAAALRAWAAMASARGDHLDAADLASRAAETAARVGHRIEAACCQLEAGRALARASCRTEAVSALTRAESEFAACGADGHHAEAVKELRRLGRRISHRRTTISGLTDREVEVAFHLSAGKTNREIAAELYISEKTIESHLAHIFRKLDVSSRKAVVQALSNRPLPDPLRR